MIRVVNSKLLNGFSLVMLLFNFFMSDKFSMMVTLFTVYFIIGIWRIFLRRSYLIFIVLSYFFLTDREFIGRLCLGFDISGWIRNINYNIGCNIKFMFRLGICGSSLIQDFGRKAVWVVWIGFSIFFITTSEKRCVDVVVLIHERRWFNLIFYVRY